MHRFLGYDLANMTNQYVGFFLDLVLLLLLVFVWKPIALALIYLELFIRIVVLSLAAAVVTLRDLLPPFVLQDLVKKAYVLALPDFIGLVHLRKQMVLSEGRRRYKLMKELWECCTCVGSLSLLLRFISGRPSLTELRKHQQLVKYSVLYRLFRHFI